MLTEKEIKTKIQKLYRSNLFSAMELLQILKVLAGIKISTRLIYEKGKTTEAIVDLIASLKIPYKQVPSTNFAGKQDRGKGGWSNLCSTSKKITSIGLYLGLHTIDVESAVKSEEAGDDEEFGTTLSYPVCCSKFFSNNFTDAASIQGDLFPIVHRNTTDKLGEVSYLLNPLWYFDAGFIEYWPCSFRCPHALAEAALGRFLLWKYLPNIATEMEKKLKSPVLYTEYSGIFCFIDSYYDKVTRTLHYNSEKILFTAKTKLFCILQAGNKICYHAGYWYIYNDSKKLHKITNAYASVTIFNGAEETLENTMFKIIKQFQTMGFKLPGTTDIEILMLLTGKKKALRLIIDSKDHAKALNLAKLLKMEYYISPKRVAVISSPGTGDEYVDYISNAPSDSKYLICFAKNKADAERCAQLETMSTSESKIQLNTLLNYPSCCVKSFLKRTPHEDWIKPFLRRSPIVNWYPVWTNRLGYLFSGVMPLFDYEPCSAFCAESFALAQTIKDTFRENNMEFLLQKIIKESSEPVFLHEGVLVLMHNANIKKNIDGAEVIYNPVNFQLKDYKLKPGVENSPFWESNKMLISGKNIFLFKDNVMLQSIKQTQYNNRIFLFEE